MRAAIVIGVLSAVLATTVQAQTYAYENRDWGIAPTDSYRSPPYHAPTPLTVPGARTIKTIELKEMLGGPNPPIVIDVLDGRNHKTLPGAQWMPWAGGGMLPRKERLDFEAALTKLTGGNMGKPIVFLCLSSECWLSYNASLRGVELGYTNVLWYRGGVDAWKGASLDTSDSVMYRVD
jgi:PQQ-dependent catabolism-associated CXXCW motif protein